MRGDSMRSQVAREAARLMLEGGLTDFQFAKRKAAERLGVVDRGALPNNIEIESALVEYQRLFRSDVQPQRLAALRASAVQAMRFLVDFEPRLAGPVLSGTADQHSAVEIHLHADSPEEVGMFLEERGIPYELADRRVRTGPDVGQSYPVFEFMAGDAPIELLVLPYRMTRQPPLSPVTGKAMQRANLRKAERLIEAPAEST
ncbi:MAG: hypothetical protein AAF458_20130 [Pseudomonadota bacterium]